MLNTNKKYVRQPFMLGEEPGIYDSINMDQEVFDLYKRAIAQMWTEDEFNYAPCKAEFAENNDGKDLMVDTLKYQWRADSLACNLYTLLQPFISNDQITQLILFNTFMECLTPDHEVLTPKGWVGIADVKVGDKVMQFDPETRELEMVRVQGTIAKAYDDNICSFETDIIEGPVQMTTRNHRMLSLDESGKVTIKTAEEIAYDEFNHFPVAGKKKGLINKLSRIDKLRAHLLRPECQITEKPDGNVLVTIENIDSKLLKLCNKLDIHVETKNTLSVFHVSETLMEAPDFTDLSSEWCKNFLKYGEKIGLIKNGEILSRRYKHNLITTIIHIAGYRVEYGERGQLLLVTSPYIQGSLMEKAWEHYKGTVYCITVPSGAFLVRKGRHISVTGNCIHSGSYSEIVKNAFPDPIKTIEDLSADEISSDRLETVSKAFCDLRQVGLDYTLGKVTREEVYADVYKGVVALYLLERIQFICSFAVTFSLGELGRFQPVAMAVRKICADETVIHAETDLLILKDMQKDPLWESTNTPEFQETLTKMVDEVIGRECAWVDQVFEGRKLPGLTPELLKEWAMFNAQIVKDNLGLKHDGKHKVNPLPFLKGWISSNTTQVANQEQNDGVQYLIGGISNDTDDVDIDLDF